MRLIRIIYKQVDKWSGISLISKRREEVYNGGKQSLTTYTGLGRNEIDIGIQYNNGIVAPLSDPHKFSCKNSNLTGGKFSFCKFSVMFHNISTIRSLFLLLWLLWPPLMVDYYGCRNYYFMHMVHTLRVENAPRGTSSQLTNGAEGPYSMYQE